MESCPRRLHHARKSSNILLQRRKLKEDQQKNYIALSFLQQAVTKAIFSRIRGILPAKEVWDSLEQEFRSDKKVRIVLLQSLRKQYANMKMQDSKKIKNYYAKFMSLVSETKAYGEDLPDNKVVENILVSLSVEFNPKMSTIEDHTKDLSLLRELISLLHVFEQRLASCDENFIENTF